MSTRTSMACILCLCTSMEVTVRIAALDIREEFPWLRDLRPMFETWGHVIVRGYARWRSDSCTRAAIQNYRLSANILVHFARL